MAEKISKTVSWGVRFDLPAEKQTRNFITQRKTQLLLNVIEAF